MREYKFRAWNKNSKKMYKIGQITLEKGIWNYEPDNREYIGMSIPYQPSSILMQYTGIKDKNGKEIYAGDIIEFSYDMFIGNFDTFVAKGKIVFEEGAFYVEVFENERTTEDEAYLLYSINLDTIEVIGNVWEDSDLLNDNKNTKNN